MHYSIDICTLYSNNLIQMELLLDSSTVALTFTLRIHLEPTTTRNSTDIHEIQFQLLIVDDVRTFQKCKFLITTEIQFAFKIDYPLRGMV